MAGAAQPSLGSYEDRTWRPSRAVHAGRRHRAQMTIRTYVPERIAEWEGAISGATAAILAEADRSVSDLNRDAPAFAGLEALSRQLLRQESIASSRIEGLVTSDAWRAPRMTRAVMKPRARSSGASACWSMRSSSAQGRGPSPMRT